jgi:hypothetical protein
MGLAQRMAAHGDAYWEFGKSVETLRANEDEGPELLYKPLI